MRYAIWCQSLFGICMVCLNACECMLTLFYTFMLFLSVCMTFQTGLCNVKRLNAIQTGNISNLMTLEYCFQISQYHENCNAMSAFTVLRHVPWNTYLHCSSMFSLVCYGFYLLLTNLFSDAAYSELSQFVEIVVKRSIFECNIQKCVPRSLQLNKIFYLQEQKYVVHN